MRTPLKHQERVLNLIKDKPRYALYLAPGLGKTFTSLHDWYHSGVKNLLIVTLPSLLTNWEEEFNEFGFGEEIKFHKLNKTSKKSMETVFTTYEDENRNVYVVSYSSVWRMEGLTLLGKNDLSLVFDESHKAKNRKSKQSKFVQILAKRFGRVRLLTGTPMSIGWEDYFVPLKLLGETDPRTKTVKGFQENFMIIEKSSTFSNHSTYEKVVGYKNIDILQEIIGKTAIFMDENSAGVELPEQVEKTYFIEQDQEFKKAMKDRVYKSWMIKNSGSKMMAHRTGLSGFLYGEDKYGERIVEKFLKQPKKDIFRDILEGLDRKVLVFYNFEQELKDIEDVVVGLGKKFSKITKDEVDVTGDVIATHYVTGSTGHNLQQLNQIIYYSPTITGSDFIQSKKRTHRIGQQETCFYFYLITKGTIEETIFEKIKMNQDYTDEMFEKEWD